MEHIKLSLCPLPTIRRPIISQFQLREVFEFICHHTGSIHETTMSIYTNYKNNTRPLATAAAAPPSLLQQVGMAGTAAVITVSFIHPIDVVKVCLQVKRGL